MSMEAKVYTHDHIIMCVSDDGTHTHTHAHPADPLLARTSAVATTDCRLPTVGPSPWASVGILQSASGMTSVESRLTAVAVTSVRQSMGQESGIKMLSTLSLWPQAVRECSRRRLGDAGWREMMMMMGMMMNGDDDGDDDGGG